MAPKLGFAALLMVMAIASFISIFVAYYRNKLTAANQLFELKSIITKLSYILLPVALFSQLMLIISFVNSDYSVKNVYQNSHHLKPLIYKIAASWGNHEGSMLLLISVLAAYNFFFLRFVKTSLTSKIYSCAVQCGIIALFCLYTLAASNPFLRNFPTPTAGLGLNPILQDIGLALHPPMLYTGYLGFCLVFAYAMGCMLANESSKRAFVALRKLLFFALGFLTLGIALGSWWAYRELGWGGYWFWDPVENVSLMPWLAGIGMVHSIKLTKNSLRMRLWTWFMAIAAMILCLLGIFLTRSGVLNSVHAFAIDANRGLFIIGLIAVIGSFGLIVFGLKLPKKLSKEINGKDVEPFSNNASWLLIANNYFMLLALLIVLIATIYPILAQGIFDESITIGAEYYNQMFSILILPFLAFMLFASKQNFQIFSKSNLTALAFSLLITSLFFESFDKKIQENFLSFLGIFLAILCFLANFFEIFISRKKLSKLSPTIAHIGFLMVIIGIITSSTFGLSKEVNMQQKQSIFLGKFDLTFDSIDYLAGKNFIARQGVFVLAKNGKKITELNPQLRYYPINDQTTNESSIYHDLLGDFYVVIGNKDDAENYAIRAYYKPLISFIWLGAALIFIAILSATFSYTSLKSKKIKHENSNS